MSMVACSKGNPKRKCLSSKMSMDLPWSGVNFVKRGPFDQDTENSWIIFDHIKRLKDYTTIVCHVYNNKYCNVLMIACCDMQYEDGVAPTLSWETLNLVMA